MIRNIKLILVFLVTIILGMIGIIYSPPLPFNPVTLSPLATITLTLEGTAGNIITELNTPINVTATIDGGETVCVDVDHPDYGVNYSCGVSNTSFLVNFSYFRRQQFNDSSTNQTLLFPTRQNNTVYIRSHQYDIVTNLTINLTGYSYGERFNVTTNSPNISTFDEDQSLNGNEVNSVVDEIDGSGEVSFQIWDISGVPDGATISEATVCVYMIDNSNENMEIWYVDNQTYSQYDVDGIGGWCGDGTWCAEVADKLTTNTRNHTGTDTTTDSWVCINGLETDIQTEINNGNDRVSWAWKLTNGSDTTDFYQYRTEDSSTNETPYLLINWTVDSYPTNVKVFVNDTLSNSIPKLFNTSALVEDEFVDGNSDVNITFIYEESILIDYIYYPKEATVTGARFNITGYNNTYNVSNSIFNTYDDNLKFVGVVTQGNYIKQDFKCNAGKINSFTIEVVEAGTANVSLRNAADQSVIEEFDAELGRTTYNLTSAQTCSAGDWYSIRMDSEVSSNGINLTNEVYCANYNNGFDCFDININSSGTLRGGDILWGRINGVAPPYNASIEIGLIDGIDEWNYTGELHITQIINDFTSRANNFSSTCTADSDGFCKLPIYLTSPSGIIELDSLEFNYTWQINPLQLSLDSVKSFLNKSSGQVELPIKIQSDNGQVDIVVDRYDYAGGESNYTILAHNVSYGVNVSRIMDTFYSGFDIGLPPYVYYLEFIPRTPKTKSVQPYGQNPVRGIWNLTYTGYGRDGNLSILVNETFDCVDLFIGTTNNKSQAVNLSNTLAWLNFTGLNGLTYGTNVQLWMWADYDCSYNNWFFWYPEMSFRGCVEDGICSEDYGG